MSQAVLDSNSYDLYNFDNPGKYGSSNLRYIRETNETIGPSSRTVTTIHKKRFSFNLVNITTAQMAAIIVSFDKDTFSFQPNPYDATNYTVKVINDGVLSYRSNTTERVDLTGIILEVA